MMRNDIDLSQHGASRMPRVVLIVATLGILGIDAWAFAPMLLASHSTATAALPGGPKPQKDAVAAPALASAVSEPVAPSAAPASDTGASAPSDDPPPTAPAAAPSRLIGTAAAAPWPQDRGLRAPVIALAPAAPTPPADADSVRLATAAPADTAAAPFDNVPLPRKRPSRLIAASLVIPLPRPRPEIEADAPAAPTAFDLQVDRMR
jgi:hypothetical protein